MVFTTEGFLKVAIESWPEWNLNPRPLDKRETKKNYKIVVTLSFMFNQFSNCLNISQNIHLQDYNIQLILSKNGIIQLIFEQ